MKAKSIMVGDFVGVEYDVGRGDGAGKEISQTLIAVEHGLAVAVVG